MIHGCHGVAGKSWVEYDKIRLQITGGTRHRAKSDSLGWGIPLSDAAPQRRMRICLRRTTLRSLAHLALQSRRRRRDGRVFFVRATGSAMNLNAEHADVMGEARVKNTRMR
jgi:hypothetical protein